MTDVRFGWVDVFAATPLTGNPLPVVPDADGLTVEQMTAITREFNQSETTFLVQPTDPRADVRLRSFTPGGVEVLGAGHNAMGAWIWLAATGGLPGDRTEFTQQIGADVLPVRVENGLVTMRQSAPRFLRRTAAVTTLAAALGLDADDLEAPAETVSTGAEHLLVRASTRAAVDRAMPRSDDLRTALAANDAEGCYLYSVEPGYDTIAYARFFNPTVGIAEDPATGTAAGPLATLLVRDDPALAGTSIRIEQGRAAQRPSILELRVDDDRVELSGTGLVVAEGVLRL
jgi:trans-2,3-dihydro-3-hydroxyanthranilate isomerase